MLIVIAIIGWMLLIFLGLMHWNTIQAFSRETNGLELFGLATVLSDDYRSVHHEQCETVIGKYIDSLTLQEIVYAAMRGIADSSKNEAGLHMNIVMTEIKKKFPAPHI